jgi:hypothetical protein
MFAAVRVSRFFWLVMRVLVGMRMRVVTTVLRGVHVQMFIAAIGVDVRVLMGMSVIVAVTPRAVVMMVFVIVACQAAPEHIEAEEGDG